MGSMDNIVDHQSVQSDTSAVRDASTVRDGEGEGMIHGNRTERVGFVTALETGTPPCEGELSSEFWTPPEPEDHFDDASDSVFNDDDDDDEESGDSINWGKPSSLSGFEEERSGGYKYKEEKQRVLELVKNGKLKDLVAQLLQSVGAIPPGKDGDEWVDIVASLSWDAAKFVKPDPADEKAMDPKGRVKIKCIACGSASQSTFIKGLVFKKHAAHKHMPTKCQKPRFLLIEGALGLPSSGLSSFESMQEEKDNVKSTIDVIETCHPNIILVEKTVSRDMHESILAKGMTLVLDMKLHRLERIARCTGSSVLHSDALNGQKLRQFNSFHFEKFVEEHAARGESSKKSNKTLMFLEGCPTRLGCTILLFGADSEYLKKIKCVVHCAVIMAYHYMLETCFLLDLRAMFSSVAYTEVLKLSHQGLSNATCPAHGLGESFKSTVSNTTNIAISHGFHEDGAKRLHSDIGANSLLSNALDVPVILSGLSSSLDSLEKVNVDNDYPLFSKSVEPLSTYSALAERNESDEGKSDFQVLISAETVGHCGQEVRGVSDDTKLHGIPSLEPQSICEGCDGSLPVRDDIAAVLDSESILVSKSIQNARTGTMCEQSHFSNIKFYKNFDILLGQFMHKNLLNQSLYCKMCHELTEAHFYYFVHHNKQLKVQVKHLSSDNILPGEDDGKLWMWSRCGKCTSDIGRSKATKRVLVSSDACELSFGKFLELSFANPSFSRKATCGHSVQRDYLYFFGLGPVVAMFRYSNFSTYSVSLPLKKLKFGHLMVEDHLKREFNHVYTEGSLIFKEIETRLKEIGSKYPGLQFNLHGSIKEFSDVEQMLITERFQFEDEIQSAVSDGNEDNGLYKYLRLNRMRLTLLLESCIWDQRLHYLLSSKLTLVVNKTTDSVISSQSCIDSTEKAYELDITVEGDEKSVYSPPLELPELELDNDVEREILIDGQDEEFSDQDGPSYPSLATEERIVPSLVTSHNMSTEPEICSQYQTGVPSYVSMQADKVVPISSDMEEGSLIHSDSSQSGKFNFRLSFNMGDEKGWIWSPFVDISEAFMNDLWRGYKPKFETSASLPLDSTAYKIITHEGSRLHIPLGKDDYIVSDYEDEFASIISCSLALLKDVPVASQVLTEEFSIEKEVNMTNDNGQNLTRTFSFASPHWSSSGYTDSDGIHTSRSISSEESLSLDSDSLDLLDSVVPLGAIHPEVSMGIGKVPGKRKYSVVCVYSRQFRQLRNRCCPSEVDYIASLSRCKNWDAKGGKSKSFFAKTLDDRFIIKEIKKPEFEAFMKFAPNYFEYMSQCYELGNQTCLAKILGIYQVTIRPIKTGKETRHDLMVMENLSFGRTIDRQYDLKGALHARYNSTSSGAGDDVLLDQNFVNDMNVSPLYVNQKSKQMLQRAVWNDTCFLKSIYVMDYSLLVGVDTKGHKLSCGIIDYLRQYTWDKQLETWVKSSLVVPRNLQPTIISPIEYKMRFRKFIGTHFPGVPDHWCSQRSSYPCPLCRGTADEEDS